MYFDLAPGYRAAGEARSGHVVEPLRRASGVHGFMPLRDDMLAILVASGPRVAKGGHWPRLKSTQDSASSRIRLRSAAVSPSMPRRLRCGKGAEDIKAAL